MATAGKLTLARLLSIALTVWLLQQFAAFRRKPGERPRYFAHLINGVLAGLLAAVIWAAFRLGSDFQFSIAEARVGILSGMLCAAVAFCCDDWSENRKPPVWLRPIEAIGCGCAMAAGTAMIYFLGWMPSMPNVSPELALAAWIVMPSAMAAIIGACVPHIYREAHRAAAACRDEARRTADMPVYEPRRLLLPSDLPRPHQVAARPAWPLRVRGRRRRAQNKAEGAANVA